MARPAKTVKTKKGTITKDEENSRKEIENKLKNGSKKLEPPEYLTKEQRAEFRKIVRELETADVLGKLDIPILSQAAITIDRMKYFEDAINHDTTLLTNSTFMASKDKYTKDFFRICNELCLSPQARAKLALAAVNSAKEKDDPLTRLLQEANES